MTGFTNPYAQMQALQAIQAQRRGERERKDALGTGVAGAIGQWAQQVEAKEQSEADRAQREREQQERMDFARSREATDRHRYEVEQAQQRIMDKAARERETSANADRQAAAAFALRATTPMQTSGRTVEMPGMLGGGQIRFPGSQRLPSLDELQTVPNPAGVMGMPGAGPGAMRVPLPRGLSPEMALDIAEQRRRIGRDMAPAGRDAGPAMPTANPALEKFARENGLPYYPGATPGDLSKLGGLRPKPEVPFETELDRARRMSRARAEGAREGAPAAPPAERRPEEIALERKRLLGTRIQMLRDQVAAARRSLDSGMVLKDEDLAKLKADIEAGEAEISRLDMELLRNVPGLPGPADGAAPRPAPAPAFNPTPALPPGVTQEELDAEGIRWNPDTQRWE